MKKIKLFFKRLFEAILLIIIATILIILVGIILAVSLIVSVISIPYYIGTGKGLVKVIKSKLVQP